MPVGVKEKADDVPAMLSKNEFVFTADAVRGAGGGSIEKGAQRMYDTMKRLEKKSSIMDERKFMELVRELMEAGFTQQEAN